jgi:hypothetical protein
MLNTCVLPLSTEDSVRRRHDTVGSNNVHKVPKELSILNMCGPLWCREAPVALMKYLDNVH